jgi:hypothetical protein
LYWLPVKRSVLGLSLESSLRLVERETVESLDFGRYGQKV